MCDILCKKRWLHIAGLSQAMLRYESLAVAALQLTKPLASCFEPMRVSISVDLDWIRSLITWCVLGAAWRDLPLQFSCYAAAPSSDLPSPSSSDCVSGALEITMLQLQVAVLKLVLHTANDSRRSYDNSI